MNRLNRIANDETSPFIGIGNLPTKSMVVGATSRGGKNQGARRLLAGFGDPNDTGVIGTGVIGNVGDPFQRLDGKPGETLCVKEEGNNTKTGWKAK